MSSSVFTLTASVAVSAHPPAVRVQIDRTANVEVSNGASSNGATVFRNANVSVSFNPHSTEYVAINRAALVTTTGANRSNYVPSKIVTVESTGDWQVAWQDISGNRLNAIFAAVVDSPIELGSYDFGDWILEINVQNNILNAPSQWVSLASGKIAAGGFGHVLSSVEQTFALQSRLRLKTYYGTVPFQLFLFY